MNEQVTPIITGPRNGEQASSTPRPRFYSRSAFKSQCDKLLQKLDFVIKFT